MMRLDTILQILNIYATESAEWEYEGGRGVQNWHKLFSTACSGRFQSPINIARGNTIYSSGLRDFTIWDESPNVGTVMKIKNNRHTIKVSITGEHYVANGGLPDVYKTVQLHFHWGADNLHGSEHLIDGYQYPLELHVVNYNSDVYNNISEAVNEPNGLAVLGTLFRLSKTDNPILEPIVEQLRHIRDPDAEAVVIHPIHIRFILPMNSQKYYRYRGSLTTPMCFESVLWTVFDDTLPISERQLNEFRKVLKNRVLEGEDNLLVNNYRPVQPLNGRNVYRSFRVLGSYFGGTLLNWISPPNDEESILFSG